MRKPSEQSARRVWWLQLRLWFWLWLHRRRRRRKEDRRRNASYTTQQAYESCIPSPLCVMWGGCGLSGQLVKHEREGMYIHPLSSRSRFSPPCALLCSWVLRAQHGTARKGGTVSFGFPVKALLSSHQAISDQDIYKAQGLSPTVPWLVEVGGSNFREICAAHAFSLHPQLICLKKACPSGRGLD